ncbi:hypothetical protein HHI36_020005 [Cryptolaemus montrouzieri]|uniref:Uncharacterized protein n=1 Tax=Cryptolaemus montrouzieri TaxID=559131 RepID=A0ABD2N963_9CUCU
MANTYSKKIRCSFSDNNPVKQFTRRDQTVINRLRNGQTNLTHVYLITKEEKPVSEFCQLNLDVSHILIECQRFENEEDLGDDKRSEMLVGTLWVFQGYILSQNM